MNFSDSPESEVHLEPSETYTMERKSNIDIWEGYKYASAESLVKDILLYFFFSFFFSQHPRIVWIHSVSVSTAGDQSLLVRMQSFPKN